MPLHLSQKNHNTPAPLNLKRGKARAKKEKTKNPRPIQLDGVFRRRRAGWVTMGWGVATSDEHFFWPTELFLVRGVAQLTVDALPPELAAASFPHMSDRALLEYGHTYTCHTLCIGT